MKSEAGNFLETSAKVEDSGARSIAPLDIPNQLAEQCSALRRHNRFLQRSPLVFGFWCFATQLRCFFRNRNLAPSTPLPKHSPINVPSAAPVITSSGRWRLTCIRDQPTAPAKIRHGTPTTGEAAAIAAAGAKALVVWPEGNPWNLELSVGP
jgi:hypothetical protein